MRLNEERIVNGGIEMENFNYYVPTRVLFGKGALASLPEYLPKQAKHFLLAYGGNSIKQNGIYDKVTGLLDSLGISYVELSGIEPNPKLASVKKGIALCREHQVDSILAVGGGSVIDCCKAICAGFYYDGDPWDLVLDHSKVQQALPLYVVPTIAATGSEMNGGGVISNPDTNDKMPVKSDLLRPVCSVLDPTFTYTVPAFQTASGVADTMSHVFESYFSRTPHASVQNHMAEGILKTCIEYGPIAVNEPDNYEARANLMWAASLALNGLLGCGKSGGPSCHPMEHPLSAYHDITHGAGLAVLTPAWMEYIISPDTVGKFAEYGRAVFELDADLPDLETAETAIAMTREFFLSLGLPGTLSELGVTEQYLEEMAQKAAEDRLPSAYVPLSKEDVLAIYHSCL